MCLGEFPWYACERGRVIGSCVTAIEPYLLQNQHDVGRNFSEQRQFFSSLIWIKAPEKLDATCTVLLTDSLCCDGDLKVYRTETQTSSEEFLASKETQHSCRVLLFLLAFWQCWPPPSYRWRFVYICCKTGACLFESVLQDCILLSWSLHLHTQMARIAARLVEDFLNCLVTSLLILPSDSMFWPVPGSSLTLVSLITMIWEIKCRWRAEQNEWKCKALLI